MTNPEKVNSKIEPKSKIKQEIIIEIKNVPYNLLMSTC